MLCRSRLLHCSGSLGLSLGPWVSLRTPSPAVPQALPGTAYCSLHPLHPGLGWQHLNPHNPRAGNLYLPLQRSRSFLSTAVFAGLVGHLWGMNPMGLSP